MIRFHLLLLSCEDATAPLVGEPRYTVFNFKLAYSRLLCTSKITCTLTTFVKQAQPTCNETVVVKLTSKFVTGVRR